MDEDLVHVEHCCSIHGCKYGDRDCPVKLGNKKQAYPCEWCALAEEEVSEVLPEWSEEVGAELMEVYRKNLYEDCEGSGGAHWRRDPEKGMRAVYEHLRNKALRKI